MDQTAARHPATLFAKTATGQEEIRTRSLALSPLARRLLVLIDGRRSLVELAAFAAGANAESLIDELMRKGCIETMGIRPESAPVASTPKAAASVADPLTTLPAPHERSAQQVEMARNFMINTINSMLEQNSRLTLVEAIFASPDAATLRQHYAAWEAAISSSWMGARRMPELRKKLSGVL